MAGNVTTTQDFSQTVGTTAVTIVTTAQLQTAFPGGFEFMKLFNSSASAIIYYTRNGATPVANTPGTYSLAAGAAEVFNGVSGVLPINTLKALSSAAGGAFTVEVG